MRSWRVTLTWIRMRCLAYAVPVSAITCAMSLAWRQTALDSRCHFIHWITSSCCSRCPKSPLPVEMEDGRWQMGWVSPISYLPQAALAPRADLHQGLRTLGSQLGVKILTLVVHHNEGGEIFHLNTPDGLHTQLWILDDVHLFDAMLG